MNSCKQAARKNLRRRVAPVETLERQTSGDQSTPQRCGHRSQCCPAADGPARHRPGLPVPAVPSGFATHPAPARNRLLRQRISQALPSRINSVKGLKKKEMRGSSGQLRQAKTQCVCMCHPSISTDLTALSSSGSSLLGVIGVNRLLRVQNILLVLSSAL